MSLSRGATLSLLKMSDKPLLDPMSDNQRMTDEDYFTDNDMPSMRPNQQGKHRKRRPRAAITGHRRRIYSRCLGSSLSTASLADVLQNTGWIVRSQPHGCVYCYRRAPVDNSAEAKRTNSDSNVGISADYNADKENENDLEDLATRAPNSPLRSQPQITVQHAFFFDFGCVVCWGCTENEENRIVQRIQHLVQNPASDMAIAEEDDMTFVYGTTLRLKNDDVTLSSTNPIEKFAISLAFAQSTKLSVYEGNVDKVIQESRAYPEALALTGHIPLTQRQVAKKIGSLFIIRYKIFLDSEMLETPEFFWESDEYEPVYVKARKYLDIGKRMEVVQQRLDIVFSLLDMVNNALENEHASRLEIIIIVLIFAEVGLQILFGIVDFRCFAVCSNPDVF